MSRELPVEPSGGEATGDMASVIGAAQAAVRPKDLNPSAPQALVVPAGASVEIPNLDAWRERPTRKTGTYRPATVDAFIAYVARHDGMEHTTVWVHPTSGRFVAVLDDNAPSLPGWGDHRAELRLEHTPEWAYWAAKDRQMLSQEDFAEHIEGGMGEIAEPAAADVLEIAQSFHATSSASFRSKKLLQSGEVQLQYDENVQASAGSSGQLEVPSMILLQVAPFNGEEPRSLAARVRFRVGGGNLKIGYQLDRPHIVIRDAIDGIAERLAGKFVNTYHGEPAAR